MIKNLNKRTQKLKNIFKYIKEACYTQIQYFFKGNKFFSRQKNCEIFFRSTQKVNLIFPSGKSAVGINSIYFL